MIEYRKVEGYHDIYSFMTPIWKECYKDVIPEGQIDLLTHKYFDYENILKYIDEGMIYEYVYFNDIKVGLIAYQLYEEYIYLDKLYLLKNYRGLHISSYTFNYLQNRYKLPIRLNVNQNNKLGLRSYLGNGFKVIEKITIPLPNNYVNYDYIMEKSFE